MKTRRPPKVSDAPLEIRRSPPVGFRARPRTRSRTMFIDVPDESALDEPVADWYERQRAAWGYLPNYAPAFATRPDVAEAWNTLNNAVRGNMDRRRFELATIAA